MKKSVFFRIGVFLILILVVAANFMVIDKTTKNITNIENNSHDFENTHGIFKDSSGKIYTEYKQYNAKWANEKYWGKTIGKKGCGITAMAIVLSGYGIQVTPKDLQKKYYPVMTYENMSNELLKNYNIKSSGFYYDAKSLSEEHIIKHLKNNKPLIVCAWAENGVNRWTKSSHYLTLLAADDENNIYVANPGGSKYGPNKNGWYKASQVVPYLAKVLYVEE